MAEPTITQTRGAFSLACGAEVTVHAPPARIWAILTDAKRFPQWNSTVTSIEGEIREGARLRIHVPGTDRSFTPTVSNVVPNERMTWSGGFTPLFKGVRTFELRARADGSTDFALTERFSGLLIPFVRRTLPDFGVVFSRFVADLRREAQRRPS